MSATSNQDRNGGAVAQPARLAPADVAALLGVSTAQDSPADRARREDLLALLRRERCDRPVIYIGMGTCGLGAGAGKLLDAVRAHLAQRCLEADIVEVGCIGICSMEPLLDVQLPGRTRVSFRRVNADRAASLLDAVLGGAIPTESVLGQFRDERAEPWLDVPYLDEHPFFAPQMRVVLANCGLIDPNSIDEYIARGGYQALARALRETTPAELCDIVEKSGLRGRGGGGFPTGRKWKFALGQPNEQKYLIANADEGDPGAFMDRAVIEGDPHRMLEGMAIAAYAIGASKAYVYIRAEYPLAIRRLEIAIAQARAYGLLGTNILESGFDLEIALKQGAGAFVCGEETALMQSIEGRRGMPRPRPPFPAVSGLFGRPTVINNVETLANIAEIVNRGADWYASIGTPSSKGTKVFALSGKVARTGLIEVPMGMTIRQILYDIGGGNPGGRPFKAVQMGGPSGGCIPASHFDVEVDYESLKTLGAIMGSGGMVVMDQANCMVDVAKFFMEFLHRESCGKCIPCREGTHRLLETLRAITRSRRNEKDIDALRRFKSVMAMEQLADVMRDTSLCGLGQTAANPVLSTLRWFRDEYEAHIYERRCPAGACKELTPPPCQGGCPVGTEVWRYVAHIARGEYVEAYKVIRDANPFPSTCARVCHHPCERVCRAGTTGGEPIAVRTLKRYVVDHTDPANYRPTIKPAGPHAAQVAVIGAGPAGLTAAHLLSVMGYFVTVFEKEIKPGGMLICAIPEYRLPRAPLEKEIAALLNDNIELRFETALGRDFTIEGLLADGYKAVYLALGAHRTKKLNIPGEEAEGVIPSIEFLKAFNLHKNNMARGAVGVIGGGNSAVDAARVALRQPGVTSVTIYYRRTRDEMPAYQEEINDALEEGVRLEPLVAPVTVQSAAGRITGVVLQRCELGDSDESGRRRPVPIAGSEFTVPLDTLIAAIGEQPEKHGLDGLSLGKSDTLEVDPISHAASLPGVFGGGDLVTGPKTLIDAVAAGKHAAGMIDRWIRGKELRELPEVVLPSKYIAPVENGSDGHVEARPHAPQLPLEARRQSFAEVELCVEEQTARCEAQRCLRCDLEFTRPVRRSQEQVR